MLRSAGLQCPAWSLAERKRVSSSFLRGLPFLPQNEGPNERGLARPHHKKILSVVEGFIVSLAVSAALKPLGILISECLSLYISRFISN